VGQAEISYDFRQKASALGDRHALVPLDASPFRTRYRSSWWRDALLRRMLALADAISALLVGLWLAVAPVGTTHVHWAAALFPIWIVLAKLHGLYDRDQRAMRTLTVDELPRICTWGMTGTTSVIVASSVAGSEPFKASSIVTVWIVACGSAVVLRSFMRSLWRRVTPPERTLIVGDGPLAEAVRRKLQLFPDMHLSVVDDVVPPRAYEQCLNLPTETRSIEHLILASRNINESLMAQLLAYCRREQVKLSIVPPVRGMFGTAVQLDNVADLPFLTYNTWDVSRSTLLLKRTLDVSVSLAALILLAPVGVLIAAAIRLASPGPIIFTQQRAGVRGRPFRMYKFRTMVANAEDMLHELVSLEELTEPVFKLQVDPRITRVGRFLRHTSLDELPQLLNVLRGEMSLVGPRPEQVELVERYRDDERVRLAVKPGLTGPMQVFGRGELSLEERLAVEREYIENLAVGRDLRILAMTVPAVLGARGAF
jgi:exopolysaccharide biosynthesis polyprenyl glycosylphosphotransferase